MRYLNYLLLAIVLGAVQGCFPIIAAGFGAGALMASDRRTAGIILEDQNIESKALNQINVQYKDTVYVNVTSFNRRVLISGQVPNEKAKADIEKIVSSLTNVKTVHNELQISSLTDLSWRSNDALITSNIKLRFLNNSRGFQPEHVKIVTENSSVFLMGLVYHKEAEAAAEIASSSRGVERVVKVFEYLD
ncbi:Osmotically-inducible protein OsmY, contains BON domain [Candidatus Nitrotoga sp. HW29]|uniref:BON domain-containing protein n=1 Tax=Candidatus Nitrotoga sp. HW29 TaxID=2886963 RepID=UPI001EF3620C|nr:BON domain-containing protein [Candidatus Nitrotoga sp. HW29]CAH1905755.1 Osmotically-inducible protein OsmY, contains BON domain [Candidatus Nitrotoga sp. HW29]